MPHRPLKHVMRLLSQNAPHAMVQNQWSLSAEQVFPFGIFNSALAIYLNTHVGDGELLVKCSIPRTMPGDHQDFQQKGSVQNPSSAARSCRYSSS